MTSISSEISVFLNGDINFSQLSPDAQHYLLKKMREDENGYPSQTLFPEGDYDGTQYKPACWAGAMIGNAFSGQNRPFGQHRQ